MNNEKQLKKSFWFIYALQKLQDRTDATRLWKNQKLKIVFILSLKSKLIKII